MIASAEIDASGEVYFYRTLGDQRFLEPGSGLYWQISGNGHSDFTSRSLWDRALRVETPHSDAQPHVYNSDQFADDELRIIEQSIYLPGSKVRWRFMVAQSRDAMDLQIRQLRQTLGYSFALLALGLIMGGSAAGLGALLGVLPGGGAMLPRLSATTGSSSSGSENSVSTWSRASGPRIICAPSACACTSAPRTPSAPAVS